MPNKPSNCPHCGKSTEGVEELLGKNNHCQECGQDIVTEKTSNTDVQQTRINKTKEADYFSNNMSLFEIFLTLLGVAALIVIVPFLENVFGQIRDRTGSFIDDLAYSVLGKELVDILYFAVLLPAFILFGIYITISDIKMALKRWRIKLSPKLNKSLQVAPKGINQKPSKESGEPAWFYISDKNKQGPVSTDNLTHLLTERGDLAVWKKGMQEWKKASEVPELAKGVPKSCHEKVIKDQYVLIPLILTLLFGGIYWMIWWMSRAEKVGTMLGGRKVSKKLLISCLVSSSIALFVQLLSVAFIGIARSLTVEREADALMQLAGWTEELSLWLYLPAYLVSIFYSLNVYSAFKRLYNGHIPYMPFSPRLWWFFVFIGGPVCLQYISNRIPGEYRK